MLSLYNFYQLLGIGIHTINKGTLVSMNSCVIYDPQETRLQGRFTIPDCIDMDNKNCLTVKYEFGREKITKTIVEIYDNDGKQMRACKDSDLGVTSITKYQNSIYVDCLNKNDTRNQCNFDPSLRVSTTNLVCPIKFEKISKNNWSVDNCPTTIFPGAYQEVNVNELITKLNGGSLPSITSCANYPKFKSTSCDQVS